MRQPGRVTGERVSRARPLPARSTVRRTGPGAILPQHRPDRGRIAQVTVGVGQAELHRVAAAGAVGPILRDPSPRRVPEVLAHLVGRVGELNNPAGKVRVGGRLYGE